MPDSQPFLRPKASVVAETLGVTDMAAFEDACDCHLFGDGSRAPLSLCGGVQRSEQPRHETGPHGYRHLPFCAGCGNRRCEECARIYVAQGWAT